MAKPKPKEEKPPGPDGHNLAVTVLIVCAIILFGSAPLLGRFFSPQTSDTDPSKVTFSFPPAGDIGVDSRIGNTKEVSVRNAPGGQILGTQAKRIFGTVTAGPIEEVGKTWWRVDYPEAPDGWVEENGISSIIWLYVLVNIIPLAINILQPIGIILSLIFIFILFYYIALEKAVKGVNEKEEEIWLASQTPAKRRENIILNNQTPGALPGTESVSNQRWEHIETLSNSINSNDWRQAIIEADIMLEDMLEKIGYEGLTVADKLKNVEESDFLTLEKAWEGHKIRNKIAHKGSDFTLSRDEAQRVINLYRQVFQEFYFI